MVHGLAFSTHSAKINARRSPSKKKASPNCPRDLGPAAIKRSTSRESVNQSGARTYRRGALGVAAERRVEDARELQVGTIAEGVERAEDAEACQKIGFTHAQGFLFGRPGDPGDVERWARGKIVYEARTAQVDVATFRAEFKRVTQ